MSFICLETSYSSNRSLHSDQQLASIPFGMVDGHQSLHFRNIHSSSGTQYIPVHGCQSFWMWSSSRADETILLWLLVGRLIPAPYQYSRNDGQSFGTEETHKIHSLLLCYDLDQQYNSGLLHQETRRNTFSQPMHRGMENPPLVPGMQYRGQFSRQIQHIGRQSFEIGQASQTEWALDQSVAKSIFQMLNYPYVDMFVTLFNHKLPLYVSPVPDNNALAMDALSMDWNCLHAYAFHPQF